MGNPTEAGTSRDRAAAPLTDLLAELQREAARDDLPILTQTRVKNGLRFVNELLEAVRHENDQLIRELVIGGPDKKGRPRTDGLRQVLPRWARGVAILEALAGIVVVDETQLPVTVTVQWERVPRHLRPEAASLASELVDMYDPRPKGGRPRRERKESVAKLGNPDTGRPPA